MKLYETDGHCAAFTATVLSCEAAPDGTYEIVLDRTAFSLKAAARAPIAERWAASRFCASERMPNDPKYIMRLRSRLRPEVR